MNLLLLPCLLATPSLQQAPEPPPADLWAAFAEGRAFANLRYRFEHVDADASPEDADASTLRAVLGFETATYRGFRGLVEFESVAPIGAENYNSTVNGMTDHPVVADPEGTEVNQLYLDYVGCEGASARIGRQEIVLDNARHVGNVGWRQNHQSFDAVRLNALDLGGVDLTYSYLDQVNRIFGDDSPAGDEAMTSHLLHATRGFEGVGRATAYAYLLDFDESDALSTSTFGARLAGERAFDEVGLSYALEFAVQSDAGDNPNDVDADYLLLEVGGELEGFSLTVGSETLSGSGDVGDKFQTPLATLHAHNGFADVFLNTPDDGLEDRFVKLAGPIGPTKATLTYHVFDSDTGGIAYGDEIDATLAYRLDEHVSFGLKLADFQADDAFADTTKIMGWMSVGVL